VSKPKTEYLNKELAAKHLGLSVRRILELAQRGVIEKEYTYDPKARRRVAVFSRSSLDNVKDNRHNYLQTAGLPEKPAKRGGSYANDSQVSQSNTLIQLLEQAARKDAATGNFAPAPAWLTLTDAETFIGLPEAFLAAQIRAGKLPALDVGVRPGGRWRVSKRDLEAIAGERHPAAV